MLQLFQSRRPEEFTRWAKEVLKGEFGLTDRGLSLILSGSARCYGRTRNNERSFLADCAEYTGDLEESRGGHDDGAETTEAD